MRLFLGIALAPEVLAELAKIVYRLRSNSDNLRWTAPESWHITLQFLGNADQQQYECLVARLSEVRAAPVPIHLAELGFFDRAGVFFADVEHSPRASAQPHPSADSHPGPVPSIPTSPSPAPGASPAAGLTRQSLCHCRAWPSRYRPSPTESESSPPSRNSEPPSFSSTRVTSPPPAQPTKSATASPSTSPSVPSPLVLTSLIPDPCTLSPAPLSLIY